MTATFGPRSEDERAFDRQVGDRIRQMREAADVTQIRLAKAAGVSVTQMRKYEAGQNRAPTTRLSMMAEFLTAAIADAEGSMTNGEQVEASAVGARPLRSDREHAFDREVGERIRYAREAAGVTQAQLAEAAGVSIPQMRKYEAGINRVAASRLAVIAKTLSVTANHLLGENEEVSASQETVRSQVRRLSALFERCSAEGRRSLIELAEALAVRP